jgi:hypothetical protein
LQAQHRLDLELLPSSFAVCRLPAGSSTPEWAAGELCSVTHTADELSVVCPQSLVPETVRREGGWRCLKVWGPLAFELTGVLASLASPLAAAAVPIFALSTFDTDYLLVPGDQLETALSALGAAGHRLHP